MNKKIFFFLISIFISTFSFANTTTNVSRCNPKTLTTQTIKQFNQLDGTKLKIHRKGNLIWTESGLAIDTADPENIKSGFYGPRARFKQPEDLLRFTHDFYKKAFKDFSGDESLGFVLLPGLEKKVFSKRLCVLISGTTDTGISESQFGFASETKDDDFPWIRISTLAIKAQLEEDLLHEFLHLSGEGHPSTQTTPSESAVLGFELVETCARATTSRLLKTLNAAESMRACHPKMKTLSIFPRSLQILKAKAERQLSIAKILSDYNSTSELSRIFNEILAHMGKQATDPEKSKLVSCDDWRETLRLGRLLIPNSPQVSSTAVVDLHNPNLISQYILSAPESIADPRVEQFLKQPPVIKRTLIGLLSTSANILYGYRCVKNPKEYDPIDFTHPHVISTAKQMGAM